MPEQMAPAEKLNNDQRRALARAALAAGADKKALAAEAGISRQWLHKIINEVMDDPEGKYEEAVKEASFRREMRDILRERTLAARNERVNVPELHDKPDRWLHSFTQQAILSHNEPQIEAADEEWRRRGRPDVVPRERDKWEFKD